MPTCNTSLYSEIQKKKGRRRIVVTVIDRKLIALKYRAIRDGFQLNSDGITNLPKR